MALWNVIKYYFYHNVTTTWLCGISYKAPEGRNYGRYEYYYLIKKAPEERHYGRKGINTKSKKPSMGDIMVEKKSIQNQKSSGGATLW